MSHPRLDHLRQATGIQESHRIALSEWADPGPRRTAQPTTTTATILQSIPRPMRLVFAVMAGLVLPLDLVVSPGSGPAGVAVGLALALAAAVAVGSSDWLSDEGVAQLRGGRKVAALLVQGAGGATTALLVIAVVIAVAVLVVVVAAGIAALSRTGD